MSGPPPKPDDKRQRRNLRPHLSLPSSTDTESLVVGLIVPAPPEGLSAGNLPAWGGFWRSPLAKAVDPVTDLPALTRLFRLYDDIERIKPLFDAEPLVVGSTGQPALHPFGKLLDAYRAEARNLEDRFGLNPKSRLQLGIHMADAVKKANEAAATKGLEPDWSDDDSDAAAAEVGAS